MRRTRSRSGATCSSRVNRYSNKKKKKKFKKKIKNEIKNTSSYFFIVLKSDESHDDELCIRITTNATDKTLTIQDSGIGMNAEDLEALLGS